MPRRPRVRINLEIGDRRSRSVEQRRDFPLGIIGVEALGLAALPATRLALAGQEKPERWVRQTAFDNDEAVGYLADRLARLGVEQELARQGAERGASVTIGDVAFDFEPTAGIDEEDYLPTRRGTDTRLDGSSRARASDRLAAKRERHAHREDGDEWSEDDG